MENDLELISRDLEMIIDTLYKKRKQRKEKKIFVISK
jgi:hypothetical protein